MWRRRCGDTLRALGQFSLHTTSPSQHTTVSVAVAQLVSLRSAGATQMPPDVQAAIDAAASDANRKLVRAQGLQLTDKLKSMSRSKHRGGVHPNLRAAAAADVDAIRARRAQRGKRRQSRHAALGQLASHAMVAVHGSTLPEGYWDKSDVAAVTAADGALGPELKGRDAAAGGLYDEGATLAYAATRMPGCYAALRRVLSEVRQAAPPGWQPATMLDFGAGPGTATWAAQQVWPHESGTPLEVTAVEPSASMSWLGYAIQQHRARRYQQYLASPPTDGLGASGAQLAESGPSPGGTLAAQPPEDDVAVEPDSTAEAGPEPPLRSPPPPPPPVPPPVPAAVRWASRLPPQRRGPVRRYDLVVAAYVLGELRSDSERRRAVDDLWRRTGRYLVLVEPGTPVGSLRVRRAREQVLQAAAAAAADADAPAAHVVAPCPHDGACPLEGRPSWCHFAQRFQRTGLQRAAKAGLGLAPRTHQDERFSYVVLARGARVLTQGQVRVAGAAPPLDEEEDAAAYLAVPDNLRPKPVPQFVDAALRGGAGGRAEADGEAGDGDVAVGGGPGRSEGGDGGVEGMEGDGVDEEALRLLLESLAGDEEEDVAARLAELEAELAAAMREEREQRRAARRAAAAAHGRGGAADGSGEGSSSDVDEADYGRDGAAAEEAARVASRGWSRLLRPPRRRSGHVLLDICSAVDAGGRHLGGREGALLRQVVSRGAAAGATGGGAAYKLAGRLRWGDVWPLHWQRRLPAAEPAAAADVAPR